MSDDNLFHQRNRQSKKVMVSACLTWHGATKPFFANDCGMKVNAVSYRRHLKKELLPAVERIFNNQNLIFIQDNASSLLSNLVQDFLQQTLHSRFSKPQEWPPSSPDCNPLDYYFWDRVQEKVYENRLNKPLGDCKCQPKTIFEICLL